MSDVHILGKFPIPDFQLITDYAPDSESKPSIMLRLHMDLEITSAQVAKLAPLLEVGELPEAFKVIEANG